MITLCDAGSAVDEGNNTCVPCSPGTYQPLNSTHAPCRPHIACNGPNVVMQINGTLKTPNVCIEEGTQCDSGEWRLANWSVTPDHPPWNVSQNIAVTHANPAWNQYVADLEALLNDKQSTTEEYDRWLAELLATGHTTAADFDKFNTSHTAVACEAVTHCAERLMVQTAQATATADTVCDYCTPFDASAECNGTNAYMDLQCTFPAASFDTNAPANQCCKQLVVGPAKANTNSGPPYVWEDPAALPPTYEPDTKPTANTVCDLESYSRWRLAPVKCAAGTYLAGTVCASCAPGSYQPRNDSTVAACTPHVTCAANNTLVQINGSATFSNVCIELGACDVATEYQLADVVRSLDPTNTEWQDVAARSHAEWEDAELAQLAALINTGASPDEMDAWLQTLLLTAPNYTTARFNTSHKVVACQALTPACYLGMKYETRPATATSDRACDYCPLAGNSVGDCPPARLAPQCQYPLAAFDASAPAGTCCPQARAGPWQPTATGRFSWQGADMDSDFLPRLLPRSTAMCATDPAYSKWDLKAEPPLPPALKTHPHAARTALTAASATIYWSTICMLFYLTCRTG